MHHDKEYISHTIAAVDRGLKYKALFIHCFLPLLFALEKTPKQKPISSLINT